MRSRRSAVAREAGMYLVPLAVLSAATWAGTFASSALSSQPLLLVALAPRAPFVLAAASASDPAALALLAAVRMWTPGVIMLLLGRRYGPVALSLLERRTQTGARLVTWLARAYQRFGLLVVLARPNQTVMLLAGVSRMSPRLALPTAFAGALGYATALVASGRSVGGWLLACLSVPSACFG